MSRKLDSIDAGYDICVSSALLLALGSERASAELQWGVTLVEVSSSNL